jgi:hypothetical protein
MNNIEGWTEIESGYRDISGNIRMVKTCRGCIHLHLEPIKTVPLEYCSDYVYLCRKLDDLILKTADDNVEPSDKCPFTKQVIRNLKIESIIK